VVLTEANNVSNVETTSTFYMYDSLRLYFTNGGGRCYIVSVGSYKDDIQKSAIEGGLAVVAKEDEPTLLLFPDAPLLSGNQLYELQQAALRQSADLGDRFAIMDLIETEGVDAKESYKAFRDNIGINKKKDGTAGLATAIIPGPGRSPWCGKMQNGGRAGVCDLPDAICIPIGHYNDFIGWRFGFGDACQALLETFTSVMHRYNNGYSYFQFLSFHCAHVQPS